MANYLALLRKDADSDFSVDFPDFPGCVTAGATLEEARVMAAEALALHIQGMIEDREPVPNARRQRRSGHACLPTWGRPRNHRLLGRPVYR